MTVHSNDPDYQRPRADAGPTDPGGAGTHTDTGPTQGAATDRPLTSLFSDLAAETTALLRKELELAKAEMSEKASQVTKGATSLAMGGAVAYAGLIFLLLSATLALANWVAPWLAALIVGGVVAIIGLIMLASGRSKLKASNLQPTRTIETIREDGRWAKAQVSGR